ncbi:MAG: hypothetical protein A2571_03065 [Candidatus Vogelbacteria bacterium RIFOXYD1_FULL_44_32]|uniref:PsbP C-terminal domain-containing protein n=1 Tax=Candidatus Vogelbacteria bacterium RIFOXYD1_FULL_44_32 TaxID=1802438 RepID=A0A1G2QCB7_9BACT|nr:MAG: hypothetical protein A2571_03065 [Candidatus Vogelbacteria bacterium RIFOXYD1_FULL_44_32]
MKNTLIFAGLILVLAGGTVYLTFQKKPAEKPVGADLVATSTKPDFYLPDPLGPKKYTHNNPYFTFNFPADFSLTEGGRPGFEDNWSTLSQATGTVYTILTLPRSFQPGTNFSEATITLAGSTSATSTCTDLPNEALIKSGPVNIGGVQFERAEISEGAAGNLYQTTVYRRLVNNICLSIESTIHSTNLGVYDQGTVKEFDQSKIADLLWSVISTYSFRQTI